tara:strand:+ start:5636 stop:5890 length:255 start_codon:yes stop_codon:yes gene_type:complete
MSVLQDAFGDPVEEINQATLALWFDAFEHREGDDLIKAIYLARDLNVAMGDILDRLDEVSLFEGDAESYVLEFVEDCGLLDGLP